MSIFPWPSSRVMGSILIFLMVDLQTCGSPVGPSVLSGAAEHRVGQAKPVEGARRVGDGLDAGLDVLFDLVVRFARLDAVHHRGNRREDLCPLVPDVVDGPVAAPASHVYLWTERSAAASRGRPEAHDPLLEQAASRFRGD